MHSPLRRRTGLHACHALLSLACVASLACATARSPAQPVVTFEGVEGWRSAHALFYVVPVSNDGDVVLVDAGMDPTGDDVRRALGARTPIAVVVTHGHIDHWSGAAALNVPVYVGRRDIALLQRTRASRAVIPRIGERLFPPPPLPRDGLLVPVDDGAVLTLGGRMLQAVSVPGHTAGSTAWIVDDRFLFAGDSLMRGAIGDVDVAPSFLTDDMSAARASLHRLWPHRFDVLFDGHSGLVIDVRAELRARLAAQKREAR